LYYSGRCKSQSPSALALKTQISRLHDEMQRQERKAEAEQWYCLYCTSENAILTRGEDDEHLARAQPACRAGATTSRGLASETPRPLCSSPSPSPPSSSSSSSSSFVQLQRNLGMRRECRRNVETRQILPDAALIRLLHVPLSHVDFVHAAGPSPTYRHFCDTTGGRVRICRDWRATWTSSPSSLFDFSDVTRTRTWTLLLYYGKYYYYYYYCATNKRIIMGAHQPGAKSAAWAIISSLRGARAPGPSTQKHQDRDSGDGGTTQLNWKEGHDGWLAIGYSAPLVAEGQ
jgi:hypothetical protein